MGSEMCIRDRRPPRPPRPPPPSRGRAVAASRDGATARRRLASRAPRPMYTCAKFHAFKPSKTPSTAKRRAASRKIEISPNLRVARADPPPNDESRLDGAIHFPRSARVDGARAAVETARRPNRRTRARHSATPRAPLGPLDSRARLREGSKGNKSRTLASKVARKGATRDARTRRDEVRQRNQTRRALGLALATRPRLTRARSTLNLSLHRFRSSPRAHRVRARVSRGRVARASPRARRV